MVYPQSCALVLIASLAAHTAASADDWPRFRGPQGRGVATAPGMPVEWELEDFAWRVKLEGVGHSSPVVLGERLYVTSASPDGKKRMLHCLDGESGEPIWTRSLAMGSEKMHRMSSYASTTPAVSKETVVVTFADNAHYVVAAYNPDGTRRWKKDVGRYDGEHGHGASPIIWKGRVIVPDDQDEVSTYLALDEATGERLWRVPRESAVASYSTPLVIAADNGPDQLITSSKAMGLTSLDPATGKALWSTGSLPDRTVGSPVFGDSLIFQSCGSGGRGRLLVGVDPNLGENMQDRVVFEVEQRVPYVPTPIFYEDHLYLWGDGGVVMCLKPNSTEPVWVKRADGDFSSSPICVNGCLYNVSERGEVVVIRAAPRFELLGRSPLGENSLATPAVAGGRMYFHTQHHLLCLKAKIDADQRVSDAE